MHYPLSTLMSGNGLRIKTDTEVIEIAKKLEQMSFVDTFGGMGSNISAKITVEGSMYVEDKFGPPEDEVETADPDSNETSQTTETENTITQFFRFPENTKFACLQYMVYFGQFLQDLEIEVSIEIKELSEEVQIKVTPVNKEEALKQLFQFLQIYLDLPALADNDWPDIENNAIAQLKANVYHLKSQLALSQATVQTQAATIESLQLSNYQYRLQLDKEIKEKDDKDEEQLIKGLLSVKKTDVKGLIINAPEILRRLKRIFKKRNGS